jgi:hypothetical protein
MSLGFCSSSMSFEDTIKCKKPQQQRIANDHVILLQPGKSRVQSVRDHIMYFIVLNRILFEIFIIHTEKWNTGQYYREVMLDIHYLVACERLCDTCFAFS